MIDRILKYLAILIYGKSLHQNVADVIAHDKADAGSYAAARYTRGNVAIQQRRYSMTELNK